MAPRTGVCIVAPPEDGVEARNRITLEQKRWVDSIRKLAEGQGREVAIFRTILRVVDVRGQENRRLFILDPWEADRLYRTLHRGFAGVFQTGQARVLVRPTHAVETSNSTPLRRVVEHKAFFAQFDGTTAASDLFAEFEEWSSDVHCESHRDCRLLPLHMFSPKRDWKRLSTQAERDDFERVHGVPSQLVDARSRYWNQTTAWHGNDSLTVANRPLPTGFHWDVEAGGHTSRMSSLTATWRFDDGAYLNVSPDGYVRAGQSVGVTAVMEDEAPRPPKPQQAKPSKRERARLKRERQLANKKR